MGIDPNYNIPILLIDDDALVREVVVEYLQSFGFSNITVFNDPKKALKVINDTKTSVGLIISDWEMPGMNGLTLLKAVRNNPKRNLTRFIMITSQRSMERFKITQAAQWKVNSYVIKPFRAETLKEKIWSVLGWNEGKQSA